jgi:hypothetical protein
MKTLFSNSDVSVKLTSDTGSIVTRNGLACWTEKIGENNPRIIDIVKTGFTTI